MPKVLETRLIIRKETKFDKIRKSLFKFYFRREFELIEKFDKLIINKKPKPTNIIIPREIGNEKNEKY